MKWEEKDAREIVNAIPVHDIIKNLIIIWAEKLARKNNRDMVTMDDPVIKGFKCIYSLIPIDDCNNLNVELEKNLSKNEIRDKYFNSAAKMSRETLVNRVQNDYNVLSGLA